MPAPSAMTPSGTNMQDDVQVATNSKGEEFVLHDLGKRVHKWALRSARVLNDENYSSRKQSGPSKGDQMFYVIGSMGAKRFGLSRLFVPNIFITVGRLNEEFDKKMEVWRQSACRRELLSAPSRTRPEGRQIEKTVCLAMGSFSDADTEGRNRSMEQFVCAMDITQQLNDGVEIYAQDPSFYAVDKEFMNHKGVKVLECPLLDDGRMKDGLNEAVQHLGQHTLVFEFFIYKSAQIVKELYESDCKLMCACESNDVLCGMHHRPSLSHLAAPFEQQHWVREFPQFKEAPYTFKGLKFYGRRDPRASK